MTYAAWSKISAARLLAAGSTAAVLGVEQALAAEWALSQPELDARWQAAKQSGESKGWRWTEEMREIARTFASAGQPHAFGGVRGSPQPSVETVISQRLLNAGGRGRGARPPERTRSTRRARYSMAR